MKTIYVSTADYRSYAAQPIDGWPTIAVQVDDDFSGGATTYDPTTETWTADPAIVLTTEQANTQSRNTLITKAQQQIDSAGWFVDAVAEIATGVEKANLSTFRQYVKTLQALDMAQATITWPDYPTVVTSVATSTSAAS